jgi:hypothetical protein
MSKNVNSVSVQDDNMTVDCINSAEGGIWELIFVRKSLSFQQIMLMMFYISVSIPLAVVISVHKLLALA